MKNKYQQRLKVFNKSSKYMNELKLLEGSLEITKDDIILDYGCGIGTAIKYLKNNKQFANYIGFDIQCFIEGTKPVWFYDKFDKIDKFNKLFFLHSFAHIPNILDILKNIYTKIDNKGLIVVITPNKKFDDYLKKVYHSNGFKTDQTVVTHYDLKTIKKIFKITGFKILRLEEFGKEEFGLKERIILVAQKDE